MTVCSLFWLGPVTNEELAEEVAHDHVCITDVFDSYTDYKPDVTNVL